MRLASRFGRYNSIRRERPLTDDELRKVRISGEILLG